MNAVPDMFRDGDADVDYLLIGRKQARAGTEWLGRSHWAAGGLLSRIRKLC